MCLMIDDSTLVEIMQRCLQAERAGGAGAALGLFKKALAEGRYVIASQPEIDARLNAAKKEAYEKGVGDAWATIDEALEGLRPDRMRLVKTVIASLDFA